MEVFRSSHPYLSPALGTDKVLPGASDKHHSLSAGFGYYNDIVQQSN
jgi:hypothetical protein